MCIYHTEPKKKSKQRSTRVPRDTIQYNSDILEDFVDDLKSLVDELASKYGRQSRRRQNQLSDPDRGLKERNWTEQIELGEDRKVTPSSEPNIADFESELKYWLRTAFPKNKDQAPLEEQANEDFKSKTKDSAREIIPGDDLKPLIPEESDFTICESNLKDLSEKKILEEGIKLKASKESEKIIENKLKDIDEKKVSKKGEESVRSMEPNLTDVKPNIEDPARISLPKNQKPVTQEKPKNVDSDSKIGDPTAFKILDKDKKPATPQKTDKTATKVNLEDPAKTPVPPKQELVAPKKPESKGPKPDLKGPTANKILNKDKKSWLPENILAMWESMFLKH